MTPRRTGLAAGVGAAAAVLLAGPLLADGAPATRGTAVLPDRLAGYSLLTGDVEDSPPGRAVALFQHGYGVEFLDFPQAIVVGWRGDAVRRVEEAEDRAGPEAQGDPAPMLLSADGRSVAVGDHHTDEPDLELVDLGSGGTTYHDLPEGGSVQPVAWAPDGRRVAYLFGGPTNPYRGRSPQQALAVLDLDTGRSETVADDVVSAAFAPSGERLAVQHRRAGRDAPAPLTVLDLADGRSRLLSRTAVLAGPASWSPDGRLLAVVLRGGRTAARVTFLEAGTGARVPGPALRLGRGLVGSAAVLGWTGPDEVVGVLPRAEGDDRDDGRAGDGPETAWLAAVPVDGSAPRRLTETTDLHSFGVSRWQVAQEALADLEVRAVADVDRGPMPWPWRLVLATVIGTMAAWVTGRLLRRRPRRTAGPDGAPGGPAPPTTDPADTEDRPSDGVEAAPRA
ncbi:TolB family protein [Nocardioides deserti]|uniref:WD40 repeat domain-containing protein n=1 Tax=Nocardioides deserti TaxID=1588644 RepID=A0ABR6U3C1_9ACTN|nr:hypothetical protein [Nocardioides deserti]MBC2958905.1 hypothetical protein [Nocardioides deserti]GGO69285.1 hypothetical protein GCM10012276_05160 [Nocardioides deserti]